MNAHYKEKHIRKSHLVAVRLQDLDFAYLDKMAKKHRITISEQLRRIIRKGRKV